jgi:hypothetical protein
LALTSPTSGGRSVGIVGLRITGHGAFVCLPLSEDILQAHSFVKRRGCTFLAVERIRKVDSVFIKLGFYRVSKILNSLTSVLLSSSNFEAGGGVVDALKLRITTHRLQSWA